ncbi:hypothetical protein F3Y22_tig00110912pilonHSYRG00046 [Hibiscus syriacus]|uniref:Uncharacterized protein n=1 Tax=Hibiscus syriacus TaxID=106335 RepID=A0A6A2ZGC9_HIBSY|nr:hypothetical protein F3Y22_tig00110912pilonHSYRG00046 [Hibiscus syriacus]
MILIEAAKFCHWTFVALFAVGITLYGGPRASSLLKLPETQSLHHEYSSLACTVDIVDDVEAAIGHIHHSHTNAIVTDDLEVAETFLHRVDIAAVFHSKCTRFCDGARFGLGAEESIPQNIICWTTLSIS